MSTKDAKDPLADTQFVRDGNQEFINGLDRTQPIGLRAEIIRHVEQMEPYSLDDGFRLGLVNSNFNPFPRAEWGHEYELIDGDVVLFRPDHRNPEGTVSVYSVRTGIVLA